MCQGERSRLPLPGQSVMAMGIWVSLPTVRGAELSRALHFGPLEAAAPKSRFHLLSVSLYGSSKEDRVNEFTT